MNTGIFGEGFPYSNFHDLNMDWIIKIAKDFLDQYTHIQEIIEQGKEDIQTLTEAGVTEIGDLTATGLQQLQDKADNLESLLQQWYNTHSEDIANQLASALEDLNTWYTQHVGYLDQYVTDSIASFTTEANRIAQETIESIPVDYTDLYNKVQNNVTSIGSILHDIGTQIIDASDILFVDGYIINDQGTVSEYAGFSLSDYIPVEANTVYVFSNNSRLCVYDANKDFVSGTTTLLYKNTTGAYIRISIPTADKYYYKIQKNGLYENKINNSTPVVDDYTYNLQPFAFPNIEFCDGYLLNSSGAIWNFAEGCVSWVYPVEAQTTYYIEADLAWINYYDSSFNHISQYTSTIKQFTTPANTAYIRIGITLPEKKDFRLKLYDRTVDIGKYYFIEKNYSNTKNLINNTKFIDNKIIYSDGRIGTLQGYSLYYDYIPVTNNVYVSHETFYCCYDSDKTLISGGTMTWRPGLIILPTDTAFIRIATPTTNCDTYTLSYKQFAVYGKQEVGNHIYVGASSEFTTIKAAVEYAVQPANRNTYIHILPGTYDIVQEYEGNLPYDTPLAGLTIGNSMHLIFEPGAHVVCNYTGSNEQVKSNFSVFNSSHSYRDDDYEIIGLDIEVNNIRYAIHDEMADMELPYTHTYRNCKLKATDSTCVVGMGLGKTGTINIKDCVFEQSGTTGTEYFVHNNYVSDSESNVTVTGCYFTNGGIHVSSNGTQTYDTDVIISNCSMATQTVIDRVSGQTQDNMNVIQFNNTIHN